MFILDYRSSIRTLSFHELFQFINSIFRLLEIFWDLLWFKIELEVNQVLQRQERL